MSELADDEARELERLAMTRLDDVDPEEIDADEYRRILKRLVELQEKS